MLYAKKVTTRKPHYCYGCAKEYPQGEILDRIVSSDKDGIEAYYLCGTCRDFLSDIDFYYGTDTFEYGELVKDERYPI